MENLIDFKYSKKARSISTEQIKSGKQRKQEKAEGAGICSWAKSLWNENQNKKDLKDGNINLFFWHYIFSYRKKTWSRLFPFPRIFYSVLFIEAFKFWQQYHLQKIDFPLKLKLTKTISQFLKFPRNLKWSASAMELDVSKYVSNSIQYPRKKRFIELLSGKSLSGE